MNDKQKEEYLQTFKHSRYGKRSTYPRAKRKSGDTVIDVSAPPVKKGKRKTVSEQVKIIKDEGAGIINKESVNALSKLEPYHLATGALKISENRADIRDTVIDTLKDKPEIATTGLEGIRERMRGEGHGIGNEDEDEDDIDLDDVDDPDSDLDDDMDDYEAYQNDKKKGPEDLKGKKDSKGKKGLKDKRKQGASNVILHHVVKIALLGAGVALLAAGAGPLAMIIGKGLSELWDGIGPMATAASLPDYEPNDEDTDTINEIISQTVDYLRTLNTNDLEESTDMMFKAVASLNPAMESSADRNHGGRVWNAKRNGLVFSPLAEEGEFGEDIGPVRMTRNDDLDGDLEEEEELDQVKASASIFTRPLSGPSGARKIKRD